MLRVRYPIKYLEHNVIWWTGINSIRRHTVLFVYTMEQNIFLPRVSKFSLPLVSSSFLANSSSSNPSKGVHPRSSSSSSSSRNLSFSKLSSKTLKSESGRNSELLVAGLINFVAESCNLECSRYGEERLLSVSGSSHSLEQSGVEGSGFSSSLLARSTVECSQCFESLPSVMCYRMCSRSFTMESTFWVSLND